MRSPDFVGFCFANKNPFAFGEESIPVASMERQSWADVWFRPARPCARKSSVFLVWVGRFAFWLAQHSQGLFSFLGYKISTRRKLSHEHILKHTFRFLDLEPS